MDYHLPPEHILELMPFLPTQGQEEAVQRFAEYMAEPSEYALFLLKGYAGTGKTSLLKAISEAVHDLGMQVELLASTGRAAKVLSKATGMQASTIHRRIYRATTASVEEGGGFRLDKGAKGTLFIVDEASMIGSHGGEATPFGSGDLLDDLLEYIWNCEDCKLIMVGDEAQLPPVGCEISDALNAEALGERYGLQVYEATLTEVLRQRRESDILTWATYLRELLEEYHDAPEGEPIPLELPLNAKGDLCILAHDEFIDTLESAYSRYGRQNVLMIAPSNKLSLMHNQGIRNRILEYEEELVCGDRLIVARNNYYYAQRRDRSDFIANGEIVVLRGLYDHYKIYGLHFADATIYLPDRKAEVDVRLLLTGLNEEQAQRSYEQRLELYNALAYEYQMGAGSGIVDTRRAIKRDPYWGALEVKYGYAITAHKAQGGQWPCIFVDLSLLGYLPIDRAMLRWLYTAITRATKQVYLINIPSSLLPD